MTLAAEKLCFLIAVCFVASFAWVGQAMGQKSVPDQTRPRPETFKKVALIEFHRQIDHNQTRYFKSRTDLKPPNEPGRTC